MSLEAPNGEPTHLQHLHGCHTQTPVPSAQACALGSPPSTNPWHKELCALTGRPLQASQETDGLKTQFVVKAQRVQPGCRTGVEPE